MALEAQEVESAGRSQGSREGNCTKAHHAAVKEPVENPARHRHPCFIHTRIYHQRTRFRGGSARAGTSAGRRGHNKSCKDPMAGFCSHCNEYTGRPILLRSDRRPSTLHAQGDDLEGGAGESALQGRHGPLLQRVLHVPAVQDPWREEGHHTESQLVKFQLHDGRYGDTALAPWPSGLSTPPG